MSGVCGQPVRRHHRLNVNSGEYIRASLQVEVKMLRLNVFEQLPTYIVHQCLEADLQRDLVKVVHPDSGVCLADLHGAGCVAGPHTYSTMKYSTKQYITVQFNTP